MSIEKTNVTRKLESIAIPYEVYSYDFEDGRIDAVAVASKIGMEADIVFKTLVTRGRNTGINVFVIPGTCELDLKKAALTAGDKNIEMIKAKELFPLTGYVHGGCSPIGMKKNFPVFLEEIAQEYNYVVISAGKIGLQVKIKPLDLRAVTGCVFADLV